jgi:hypothetical protein
MSRRNDVIPGGSVALLKWIDEICAVSEDQSRWDENRAGALLGGRKRKGSVETKGGER